MNFSSSTNKKFRGHMGKTVAFNSEKDHTLFMKDFLSPSYMQEKFNSYKIIREYNTNNIDFKNLLIKEIIKKDIAKKEDLNKYNNSLENLHKCLNESKKNLDDTEQNEVSVNFYEVSNSFKKIYFKFLKTCLVDIFKEPIYFQSVPTFRFHFPNQKGYEWEDRYHTDIMLGHPPYEFNVWIPLTKVFSTNSMRITPLDDSLRFLEGVNYDFELFAENVQYDDYFIKNLKEKSSSLEMDYGQFIIFDPRCLHCTQNNQTNATRISLDIRIITESGLRKYSREYRTTGRKKMLFQPGHYFSEIPIKL